MSKNNNYILTIMLYPFLMIISYLKLSNYLKSDWYTYLIIVMLLIFIPSFIMSLYNAAEEILKSKKKWRIIFLIALSIFYLPIFYTKYISKEEKYLGYILFLITIPLTFIAYQSWYKETLILFQKIYRSYAVINENYIYFSSNNLFTINIDKSFRCERYNIGDYVISCDRLEDDSFIGVYSYEVSNDDEDDILEKFNYHITQVSEYIEEGGYTYELFDEGSLTRIVYGENTILLSQNNYLVNDLKYSLIIMKEMPTENVNYEEYQKMIDSIMFLNYNERVSS